MNNIVWLLPEDLELLQPIAKDFTRMLLTNIRNAGHSIKYDDLVGLTIEVHIDKCLRKSMKLGVYGFVQMKDQTTIGAEAHIGFHHFRSVSDSYLNEMERGAVQETNKMLSGVLYAKSIKEIFGDLI